MLPFRFQFLRSLAERPRKGQLPTPLRAPAAAAAAATETAWALRSRAAQGSVEGRTRSLGNPASQCPRGRRCDLPTAPTCTRRGLGCLTSDGSRRQRTASRGSAHPGGAGKPDVELRGPRDGLCNRQGPQPGRRRRPRGTSASRAPPAAQPGRSLVAAPRGSALTDADATIFGAGPACCPRLPACRLPKLLAPAAKAQDSR
ncbi:uncharacterized protein LOC121831710 [Peromyscus maniculatus bairdii]|uniref:uncharacterized protein LOC121831710 n=1 Tax=Peromyscus maniculatus bairdii TaxID=230844 RepID=UPI001C2E95F3|nr:uncharacterized protein LOC121831710 [Peromyscus maniculatus bairdii]